MPDDSELPQEPQSDKPQNPLRGMFDRWNKDIVKKPRDISAEVKSEMQGGPGVQEVEPSIEELNKRLLNFFLGQLNESGMRFLIGEDIGLNMYHDYDENGNRIELYLDVTSGLNLSDGNMRSMPMGDKNIPEFFIDKATGRLTRIYNSYKFDRRSSDLTVETNFGDLEEGEDPIYQEYKKLDLLQLEVIDTTGFDLEKSIERPITPADYEYLGNLMQEIREGKLTDYKSSSEQVD